ncbi:glycosyltransferase involved in cell wall biosynthesis [Nocardioides albertanoniae]|uniref:Glycosyltransferase involved in cell wall biosynthesis n=1 Tax=Nocardioides albertanoniae TaxID=1175486 RepID=A0A543AA12_9ACTN|nr:glycosyltransferase [Nocardioides albertanoniae]TQL69444.1 glycosyltransferase involved in cell wall biosynthesis [Nocardioides albertanoniae]
MGVHIVAFGTYDVTAHPRVAVLIEGLRDGGAEVSEVNRPLGLDTAARVAILRQPWRLPLLALRLLACWSGLAAETLRRRRHGRPDAVLVGYLGHFDVHLARLLHPRSTIFLDHMVSAAGVAANRRLAGSGGLKLRLMKAIDAMALRSADVVIVDTYEQQESLPEGVRERSVVCAVGATKEWFDAGAEALRRPTETPLQAVFVGLFSPTHGAPVIADALDILADDERIEVTMVGQGQQYDEARRLAADNPRVTWVDWVEAEDLPDFVAGFDVSLGIFGTVPQALRVVPNKAFQGAAAGAVVVTSDTAPQRRVLQGAALLVAPGSSQELAAALAKLAEDPDEAHLLRQAAYARAMEHYTPRAVASAVIERIRHP